VVDGLFAGGHRSLRRGAGAEFQQHRPYRAGDDLKHLDWKLLARSDRLYSRQFREMTGMSVMIVLDTSASMDFPDAGVSKLRYACILAASLAYVIITQGDAVGLLTGGEGRLDYLPARSGRVHLASIIGRIDQSRAAGDWNPDRTITRAAELLRRRGVVIVISDFYDDEDATRAALRRVARAGHDTAMLQVLSDAELKLPYDGEVEFVDAEDGARRLVDVRSAAAEYAQTVAAFTARCRTGAARDGVDYALAATSDPPADVLRKFLLHRSARGVAAAAGVIAR
ncbi:MAG: DUF58 domain-containing protein, partial [Gemmatimonadota bacterium]